MLKCISDLYDNVCEEFDSVEEFFDMCDVLEFERPHLIPSSGGEWRDADTGHAVLVRVSDSQ